MPMLAEIADKMPTFAGTAAAGVAVALVALFLSALSRWLLLLPMPLIAFGDWNMWGELHEPGFGDSIIGELGWGWVAGQWLGWNAPYLAAVLLASAIAWRRRRLARRGRQVAADFLQLRADSDVYF